MPHRTTIARAAARGVLVLLTLAAAGCGAGVDPRAGRSGTPAPATPTVSTPASPSATVSLPPGSPGANCPEDTVRGTQVTFGNGAGATLGGVVFGTGRSGVVLAHQSDGTVCQWSRYAVTLAGRGYVVLAFDFAGYGSSTGRRNATPLEGDLAAGVALLRQRGVARVVLVGASMGGTAVVAAGAAIRPPVSGVISLSGGLMYRGTDALGAARKLTVPVLYAGGDRDGDAAGAAGAMYTATPATTPRLVVVVPVSDHGVLLVRDGTAPRVASAVDAFLARYAPPG